jgi:DNA-binding LytR/AlgR family response regulator
MKVFLVEDEWVHAEDIRISIENLNYEWLGYSSEGFDAIQKIKELTPDVILLDMTLHGALSGIAIAEHIAKEIKKPFIFITSHTEEDIIEKGLGVNPVAYLTKPINEGDLKAALIKAKNFASQSTEVEDISYELSDAAEQFLIRIGKNLKPVLKNNISFIQTDAKNYCKIFTKENTSFTVKKSLSGLQELLSKKYFYRIHKEYIINVQQISKVDEAEHLVYILNQAIPIGNNYKQAFFELFNIL